MHRNERIALALSTLQAIEAAVMAQANDPTTATLTAEQLQARVNNTVRIYCAHEVATAAYSARGP